MLDLVDRAGMDENDYKKQNNFKNSQINVPNQSHRDIPLPILSPSGIMINNENYSINNQNHNMFYGNMNSIGYENPMTPVYGWNNNNNWMNQIPKQEMINYGLFQDPTLSVQQQTPTESTLNFVNTTIPGPILVTPANYDFVNEESSSREPTPRKRKMSIVPQQEFDKLDNDPARELLIKKLQGVTNFSDC